MARSASRIGILGGSFNPVHNGHLGMAAKARETFGLNKVFFVVANCSPFKVPEDMASAKARLAMLRLAVKGHKDLIASDVEIKRGGISYTVDTLKYFRRCYPESALFFIVGEDSVARLREWKNLDKIVCMASFIAVNRRWWPVSSSQVRRQLGRGKTIRSLIPAAVVRYIKRYNLYAS